MEEQEAKDIIGCLLSNPEYLGHPMVEELLLRIKLLLPEEIDAYKNERQIKSAWQDIIDRWYESRRK